MAKRKIDWLKRAERAIERDTDDVYDFASSVGQIVGNVKHMRWFREGLAKWMEESS
jgi:hypothetical protein